MYYSCQMYLYCTSLVLHIWLNESLYLLNVNALTKFLHMQRPEQENVEVSVRENSFLLMKLNSLINTKTCLSSCKKSINQMQFIVK